MNVIVLMLCVFTDRSKGARQQVQTLKNNFIFVINMTYQLHIRRVFYVEC
jgi:hypothetical protein